MTPDDARTDSRRRPSPRHEGAGGASQITREACGYDVSDGPTTRALVSRSGGERSPCEARPIWRLFPAAPASARRGLGPRRAHEQPRAATPIAAPLFRGLRRAARRRDAGRDGITAARGKAGPVSGVAAPSAILDAMRAAGMRLRRHACRTAWRPGSSRAALQEGRRRTNGQRTGGRTALIVHRLRPPGSCAVFAAWHRNPGGCDRLAKLRGVWGRVAPRKFFFAMFKPSQRPGMPA